MSEPVTANNNYKEGLKGTTLFGGVQIYKILISVIRSKLLAIFLGPSGVGVLGILSSATDFVYSLSNFGLGTSAVRDISEANKEGDIHRLSFVSMVFKKLVWVTGLLGLSICLFFAPVLSQVSFGSHDYTFTFAILSAILLFRMLSEGQNTLLQGTHNLRMMAKSNVWGNTFGLIVTAPLYYFFGVRGIAPALILTYLINLLVSWYYSSKIKLEKVEVSYKQTLVAGKKMLKLGGYIALSGLISTIVPYIIQVFIEKKGGIQDVGLYVAGFAIVNTYVGMVFTAMATEYFPRLSSITKDSDAFNIALNQQMQICILLIAPLICAFIVFSKIAIVVLYSNDFLGIEHMILFAVFAILFKAPSWCCSYAILAQGDGKIFFVTEMLVLILQICIYMCFYVWLGLTGIGIAFIVMYIYYLIQEWIVCRKRYGISLEKEVIITYLPHFALCSACLIIVFLCKNVVIRYCLGALFMLLDLFVSYKELNKRVNIKQWLLSRK